VLASWKKWPNAERPDVLSVDLLNKDYDSETGVLTATRLVIMRSFTPRWLQLITGSDICFFVEQSITDPQNKRLILRGQNHSFNDIVEMTETCIYTESKEKEEWTHFEQEAAVTAYPWGVARKMEKFVVDNFEEKVHSGRQILEQTIELLKEEGIAMGVTADEFVKEVFG